MSKSDIKYELFKKGYDSARDINFGTIWSKTNNRPSLFIEKFDYKYDKYGYYDGIDGTNWTSPNRIHISYDYNDDSITEQFMRFVQKNNDKTIKNKYCTSEEAYNCKLNEWYGCFSITFKTEENSYMTTKYHVLIDLYKKLPK
jgi:hypothetical protein